MGKHKNNNQNRMLLEFMETNSDIAKGFIKREKSLVESLWQQLAEDLNSVGPPNKDASAWKKAWTEWKSEVKKKLARNKMEAGTTSGGSFSKHGLSSNEKTVARLCGMSLCVEGVIGVDIGVNNNEPKSSKRKHNESNEFLEKPVQHIENVNNKRRRDAADVFAEGWAIIYRQLPRGQQIFAKRGIDELLMQGQLGILTYESVSNIQNQSDETLISSPTINEQCADNDEDFEIKNELDEQ